VNHANLERSLTVKAETSRPLPLALTLLIALFAAAAALAVSGGHDAQAHGTAHTHATASISRQELALRNQMRRLWEDHVVWTRMAIVSLTSGSPDTEATVARLLRNQTDIGNAVKPFYGNAAGNALTELLRDHILIAADVIAAAKAGRQADLADAQARWSKNANDIAALLAKANPRHWKRATVEHMLAMHLELTTEEAVARLRGDWAADVAAYDRVHRHALGMADLLSSGLVKQFPRRFGVDG
jgi:hypothetical protein